MCAAYSKTMCLPRHWPSENNTLENSSAVNEHLRTPNRPPKKSDRLFQNSPETLRQFQFSSRPISGGHKQDDRSAINTNGLPNYCTLARTGAAPGAAPGARRHPSATSANICASVSSVNKNYAKIYADQSFSIYEDIENYSKFRQADTEVIRLADSGILSYPQAFYQRKYSIIILNQDFAFLSRGKMCLADLHRRASVSIILSQLGDDSRNRSPAELCALETNWELYFQYMPFLFPCAICFWIVESTSLTN